MALYVYKVMLKIRTSLKCKFAISSSCSIKHQMFTRRTKKADIWVGSTALLSIIWISTITSTKKIAWLSILLLEQGYKIRNVCQPLPLTRTAYVPCCSLWVMWRTLSQNVSPLRAGTRFIFLSAPTKVVFAMCQFSERQDTYPLPMGDWFQEPR